MTVWVIARLTFREAQRRWILWAALLLGLAFLGVYGLGFYEIQKDIQRQMGSDMMGRLGAVEFFSFFELMGLYVVNFLASIMAVLTSVDTLSGEIASGTVHTLVSKPVRRWEIVAGKWLGFACMLTLYLLLMAGGVVAVGYALSQYLLPNVLLGLVLMWINVLLLLGVSLAGGSLLSTLANGVLVFGLYGVAFIGGWVEQIGAFINNTTAVNIGIACSLLIPSDALWRRAAFEMRSALSGVLSGSTPFTAASVPNDMMVGYAVLYAILALGLAVWLFGRRDL